MIVDLWSMRGEARWQKKQALSRAISDVVPGTGTEPSLASAWGSVRKGVHLQPENPSHTFQFQFQLATYSVGKKRIHAYGSYLCFLPNYAGSQSINPVAFH